MPLHCIVCLPVFLSVLLFCRRLILCHFWHGYSNRNLRACRVSSLLIPGFQCLPFLIQMYHLLPEDGLWVMLSSYRRLRGLGRGGGGDGEDPRLGHDPRRGRQECLTVWTNLSVRGRRLLLRGWGSAGPGPPLPPPPPPLFTATAAAASPSPQGRRPGSSAASTFPAPLPPPFPAPPAAAARQANSLPWARRLPASVTQPANQAAGTLP